MGWCVNWGHKAYQLFIVDHGCLHIQRDIKPNWAFSSMCSFIQCALQMVANHQRIINQSCILGNRLHHADDIQFLHSLLTDTLPIDHIRSLHLSRNHKHRGGFQKCSGHACKCIGATRASCDHYQAQSVIYPSIGLRCNSTCLFMKAGHIADGFATPQRVIQVHSSAPGKHEHMLYASLFQPSDDVI